MFERLVLVVLLLNSNVIVFRYRHQVELVRFLNQFADPQQELSPGWDKKVDQNGRVSFSYDHLLRLLIK